MNTVSLKDKNAITDAMSVILNGGIIVYPTDTLYGFGVDARNKLAIKKLNDIKKHKLLIFRSSKHIYASVLSESNDKTLCSFSSVKLEKAEGQKKVDVSKIVGTKIAELAI